MHPLAISKLRELERKGIRFDAIADFALLARINSLAEAIANPPPHWSVSAMMRPARTIGGVTMHVLSIGAWEFLCSGPYVWFEDYFRQVMSLAYCMAHARTPRESLWPFIDRPDDFLAVLNDFSKQIGVPWDEFRKAVEEFFNATTPPPNSDRHREPSKRETVIEILCAEYGRDPYYWVWESSNAEVCMLLAALEERRERENRSMNAGNRAPDPNARWVRSREALRVAIAEILSSRAPGPGQPGAAPQSPGHTSTSHAGRPADAPPAPAATGGQPKA